MTSVRAPLAAVVVVLGATAAGGACITDRILVEDERGPPPHELVADPAQMRRVEREVAALRHLPFLEDVPADVMTVHDLQAWFDRFTDARKAELEREDRFFHRTGILPPAVSTAEAYKGFIADFVGGVYDDANKRMILIEDYAWWAKVQQDLIGELTGVDQAYEVFLAHELDHALQDQHFGLGEMLRGSVYEDNDDAAYVRKTLLESEANVVGMAHFLGMDLDQLATRKAFFLFLRYNNLLNGPLLLALSGRTPSFFAKQGFAQYELGLGFVERKLDEGGMDAVSRAYVAPPGTPDGLPESTEQLLWPRKMHDAPIDRPIPIARLEQPLSSLPGSSLVLTNVFGALAFRHWMEALRGPLEGLVVADGWGGDRWDVIDDGGNTILLWRTTWDSDDDARQFFDAYTAAVPARYGGRATKSRDEERLALWDVPAAPDEKSAVRTTREERVLVERRGRDVLVLEGATPDELEAAQAEAWTLLVRGAPPVVDEAKIAARRAELETHIGAAPATEPRPDLLGRLFLPARTMAARLGAGVGVDVEAVGTDQLFAVNDGEFRWGVRPHLQLSLPLGLHGEIRTPLGQTVLGARLGGLFPSPRFGFDLAHAIPAARTLVFTGQASLDDVVLDPASRAAGSRRYAFGALAQPLEPVVVASGIATIDDDTGLPPVVILGSALRRGAASQPLLELEVLDGLFVTETSALLFEARPQGLHLFAHTHALGLLLYF
jgi:hypothetical protein